MPALSFLITCSASHSRRFATAPDICAVSCTISAMRFSGLIIFSISTRSSATFNALNPSVATTSS